MPVTYQGVVGAVADRNAVVTCLSPSSCIVGGTRGPRHGGQHRECYTEHRLVHRSHSAVARRPPAYAHSGRKSRKAVASSRNGGVALDPPSGSGVRIRRQDFSNLLGLSPAMNVSSCSVNMSSRITKPFRSKCTAASEAVATLATWPVISLPSARDGHSPSRRWPHL